MKIVLDIQDNFDDDVKDKFQEFFHRVYEDITNNHSIMCGNYERETVEMFLVSFNNATYLKRDMTNGDMIKAVFPKYYQGILSYLENSKWWNSLYKKEV